VRAREDARDAAPDAFLEAVHGVAVAVVREEILKILLRERPAVRALRELAQDALGAELLVVAARRVTDEDLLAARRRRKARGVVRPADLERRHAEHAILAAARHEHLQLIVGLRE